MAKKAEQVEHLIIGADLGNYSTEIKGEDFVHTQITSIAFSPNVFPKTDEAREKAVKKIMSNLKVHVRSEDNNINNYYFVGDASINSGSEIEVMDIKSGKKADHKIPLVMLLAMIAGNQVQRVFENDKDCDETAIEVSLGTAIPASEFTPENAEVLEKRILGTHYVTVYYADTKCLVKITFKNAKVTEEGRTAMLHISKTAILDKEAFNEYTDKYNEAIQLTDDTYTLHYDIGNGTIEATYMKGLTPINSDGKRAGVGIAILKAVEVYNKEMDMEINRQEFVEILMSNTPAAVVAKRCLHTPLMLQIEKIMGIIDSTFKELSKGKVHYIFVHGGGAIILKEWIIDKLYDYAHSKHVKLVYMKKEHSPHLNSNGCYELAVRLYGAKVGA